MNIEGKQKYLKESKKKCSKEKKYLKEGKKYIYIYIWRKAIKNVWRKATIFEGKQKKYIWRKAIKNIWRRAKKNCRKAKTFEGKQNYLKESKNTWRKAKSFLTEFWHLRAIVSNEWFCSQCYNQAIGLETKACWKIIILIEIYIWLYEISFPRLWKRIPVVTDDNEKDFKNGEHLIEWLGCCKWLHFSLNWRIF